MKSKLLRQHVTWIHAFCVLAVSFVQLPARLSAQPAIEWDKTFGGSSSDNIACVKPTADGGYIAAGSSASMADGDKSRGSWGGFDFWVVKLAADGTKEWDRTYGGQMDDQLVQVFQTSDGGYMLAGHSKSDAYAEKGADDQIAGGGSRGDFWLVKIDATGSKNWDKTIGGTSDDILEDAKQTADGGYILAGSSTSGAGADKTQPSAGLQDFWLVRVDAKGNIIWDRTIGSGSSDRNANIAVTADGGYILGGGVKSEDEANARAFAARMSEDGTVLWSRDLGVPNSEVWDMIATSDGGYAAAVSELVGEFNRPFSLLKMDGSGTQTWRKTYTGGLTAYPLPDVAMSTVRETADGGFLMGGFSNEAAGNDKSEYPKGRLDVWIVKADANGAWQWDKTIGGHMVDHLIAFEATPDGGYILAANSYSSTGEDKSEPNRAGEDYWLVKLAPQTPDTRLRFSASSLDLSVVQDSVAEPGSVKLITNSGTPDVTLTASPNVSWLIPPTGAGRLQIGVDAAGLLPGTYQTTLIASAPGYTGDTLLIHLNIKSADAPVTIRIDAGGDGFTTADGRVFSRDRFYHGTDRVYRAEDTQEIQYTADDVLYWSERSADAFQYDIPVTNGSYMVVLHFAEIWFGSPIARPARPGLRMFHVDVEGERKLTDYDPYAKANGNFTALEEAFPVDITDGMINVDFITGSANWPTVAAIEIVPQDEYFKTVLTLPVAADAYVHTHFPDQNFGTDPELIVKAGGDNISRNTYLKFDLRPFQYITSARLRIYGANVETTMNVGTAVHGVEDDAWTETGITFSNAPVGSRRELTYTTINHLLAYREFDLTEFVQNQVMNDKVVSLLVKNPTSANKKLGFHSKENVSGLAPELVVTSNKPVVSMARKSAAPFALQNAWQKEDGSSVIFPNPVRKAFRFKLSSKHEGDVSMRLIDQAGTVYDVQKLSPSAGHEVVDITRAALKPGIYLLKIQSHASTEMVRVVITE
ncbi:CBM96 family carbohydrate-binding protein [Dyadobacter sandarakinus]|uniref:DNRLRE domain-containing protein n=1 Tax=Dyadobacter sandarakinus TaxID=2747268 RepID=A0ABX7I4H1_9BACT|nr:malectin domain-containing carbohydrate-binding protein [Dyadobacter sandarakinus]QRR00758.1 DNRLRE domain-containing protein [Dyadobacter sandarakinus]